MKHEWQEFFFFKELFWTIFSFVFCQWNKRTIDTQNLILFLWKRNRVNFPNDNTLFIHRTKWCKTKARTRILADRPLNLHTNTYIVIPYFYSSFQMLNFKMLKIIGLQWEIFGFRKAIKSTRWWWFRKSDGAERERERETVDSIKLKCDIRAVDFISFFLSFVTV